MFEAFTGVPDGVISAKMVSEFLDENSEATEITVRINSRGGDVQEGWTIYDLLTSSGKKITTIGEGKIYSIATIIFLAGSDRQMMRNADGLIHNPYIPPYTLADAYESGDLIKIAEGLKQEEEKILEFYAEKTGTDKDKLAGYMKEETKLSAEDMLTLGFATAILEPVKAYAYMKPKHKFNMTPNEEKAFFERLGAAIDGAVAKVAGFSRLPAAAQELTDKDGNVLKIDKESGDPAVGDAASPDGTYTMPDGKVITVSGGVITEIEGGEAPEEMDESAKEIEALKAKVAELEAEKEAAAAALAAAETEKVAFAAQQTEYNTLITELRAIKNEWKPDGRSSSDNRSPETPGVVNIDRVKEIVSAINKNDK